MDSSDNAGDKSAQGVFVCDVNLPARWVAAKERYERRFSRYVVRGGFKSVVEKDKKGSKPGAVKVLRGWGI